MPGTGRSGARVRLCQAKRPDPISGSIEGGGGTPGSSPIEPIASGASSTRALACSAMYLATPRSPWAALCVPRASSQTEPGAMPISAGAWTGGDLVLALGRFGAIEKLPQGGELGLDPRKPLVEGAQLIAEIGHRLDRGRAEPLRLPAQVAELVVKRELQEAAESPPHAGDEDR